MTTLPASEPTCDVPLDTIEDAHQLRGVITGITCLLLHPHRTEAVEAARRAALEAQAICDRVVAHLDVVASEQHAKQRVEQAQRIEHARQQAAGGVR